MGRHTGRLASLVVHVKSSALVYTRHHLEVRAVEAVDSDHAGLGLHVGIVRVGGVQIIFKHCKTIEMLYLQ